MQMDVRFSVRRRQRDKSFFRPRRFEKIEKYTLADPWKSLYISVCVRLSGQIRRVRGALCYLSISHESKDFLMLTFFGKLFIYITVRDEGRKVKSCF